MPASRGASWSLVNGQLSNFPESDELKQLKLALRTTSTPNERVVLIQNFVAGFTYRKSDKQKRVFDTNMYRVVSSVVETGRAIARSSHPIRCVEAVFMGIALTQLLEGVERFTIRFHSKDRADQAEHKHIVLGVQVKSKWGAIKWGAIGLSREPDLMAKDLRFESLAALVKDFALSYEGHGHELLSASVGLPVSHTESSGAPVCWGFAKALKPTEGNAAALRGFPAFPPSGSSFAAEAWQVTEASKRAQQAAESSKRAGVSVGWTAEARDQVAMWEQNALRPEFLGVTGCPGELGKHVPACYAQKKLQTKVPM
jgi:hypothetical protein